MPKRSRRSRRRVTLFSRFRRELRTLSLADRCLFFMFLVLLVQSAADSGSGTAMVTQFRDFISGAVGFLTGCASRGSGTTPD